MPVFKDRNSKEWQVCLDAPTIRAVRQECEVDLGALDGAVFQRLEADPVLLVDVLWVVCRSQAGNVTDEDFGRALVGDPIAKATEALTEAWLDFFPERKRLLLRSLASKQAALNDKAMSLALAKVSDPQLEERLLKGMEDKLTRELENILTQLNGANSSPESSALDQKGEP